MLIPACTGKHLITDEKYRTAVESGFENVRKLASNRSNELFSVFDNKLTREQTEALEFLFAFMPLNDLADYDGDFFLANADRALATREGTIWGPSIPEDIFLHYVLPVRVNNENLDSFRIAYFDEIKRRTEGLGIIDAALEINHWCHEKVTYQPSDSRTSAPMSTILSARGRCGEESTFTVSALRTAGIPARQVYTPRWAHSDDNHAWVEFWADGRWYYMGACEPEAAPDRGWFTEPAKRAMLVNTKSFGAFSGNENIINRFEKYTEINNLAKYAVTKKIYARTIYHSGAAIENAFVEFQLYNYAEFFPLAVVRTDASGGCSFETGLGDLIVWGRKGDNFDFRKISVAETDTITLTLEKRSLDNFSMDLDLSVPLKRIPQPGPSAEITEQNNKKLENENRIREEYINSWITRKEAVAMAQSLELDTIQTADLISRSMGNFRTIVAFLTKTPDSLKKRAITLLSVISDKDLRDTRENVLTDHLIHSSYGKAPATDDKLFAQYVLNPRIAGEILSPWRSYFLKTLPENFISKAVIDPPMIVALVDSVITIKDEENYSRTPMTPKGVWSLRLSDTRSRAICFIAVCRSLGIPARLEPGSNVPQYMAGNRWCDVYFSGQSAPSSHKGYISFTTTDTRPVPEYYIHFTIARFENGRYNTLEYNENTKVSGFGDELQLAPGNYMLVTGNRLNDSRILSEIKFFTLGEGEHKKVAVNLRHDQQQTEILGLADLKKVIAAIPGLEDRSAEISGAGALLIWLEPDREPTKHVLNDLPLLKDELDSWPGYFVFLNVTAGQSNDFINADKRSRLPKKSLFSSDSEQIAVNAVLGRQASAISFPLIVLVNNRGEIIFRSEGYRIGIGEQILKIACRNM